MHHQKYMLTRKNMLCLVQTYLYSGDQVSMCPPPLTMNWCPLDYLLIRLAFPVSFRHNWTLSSHTSTVAMSTTEGWLFVSLLVPLGKQELGGVYYQWLHLITTCQSNQYLTGDKYSASWFSLYTIQATLTVEGKTVCDPISYAIASYNSTL